MLLSRKKFIKKAASYVDTTPGSPMWLPEEAWLKAPAKWFVICPPMSDDGYMYFKTIAKNNYACYYASQRIEWWGFLEKSDAVLWLLQG